jgi:hypothetical protein
MYHLIDDGVSLQELERVRHDTADVVSRAKIEQASDDIPLCGSECLHLARHYLHGLLHADEALSAQHEPGGKPFGEKSPCTGERQAKATTRVQGL